MENEGNLFSVLSGNKPVQVEHRILFAPKDVIKYVAVVILVILIRVILERIVK